MAKIQIDLSKEEGKIVEVLSLCMNSRPSKRQLSRWFAILKPK